MKPKQLKIVPEHEPYPNTESCVLLSARDVGVLLEALGAERLKYWVSVLNNYKEMYPKKFRAYASHKAVIQNWDRRARERGSVWTMLHPDGPGFYPSYEVERLYRSPDSIKRSG